MSLDKEIFKGKTLSDLFGEIYDNSKNTKEQVKGLISQLKDMTKTLDDAVLLVPLIKEYLEIRVKNDEHLIKLAQVIQRIENSAGKDSSDAFNFDEIQKLLEEVQASEDAAKNVQK